MARTTTLLKTCEQCSQEFETLDPRKRFCNRKCSATRNNRARGKKIRIPAKTTIQKYLDGDFDGTVKAGLSQAIRKFILEEMGEQCEICGFSGVNPVSGKTVLTVDHIDGDSTNNKRENLKVLCPNHHAMTPTYGALNKGRGRKARYSGVR